MDTPRSSIEATSSSSEAPRGSIEAPSSSSDAPRNSREAPRCSGSTRFEARGLGGLRERVKERERDAEREGERERERAGSQSEAWGGRERKRELESERERERERGSACYPCSYPPIVLTVLTIRADRLITCPPSLASIFFCCSCRSVAHVRFKSPGRRAPPPPTPKVVGLSLKAAPGPRPLPRCSGVLRSHSARAPPVEALARRDQGLVRRCQVRERPTRGRGDGAPRQRVRGVGAGTPPRPNHLHLLLLLRDSRGAGGSTATNSTTTGKRRSRRHHHHQQHHLLRESTSAADRLQRPHSADRQLHGER